MYALRGLGLPFYHVVSSQLAENRGRFMLETLPQRQPSKCPGTSPDRSRSSSWLCARLRIGVQLQAVEQVELRFETLWREGRSGLLVCSALAAVRPSSSLRMRWASRGSSLMQFVLLASIMWCLCRSIPRRKSGVGPPNKPRSKRRPPGRCLGIPAIHAALTAPSLSEHRCGADAPICGAHSSGRSSLENLKIIQNPRSAVFEIDPSNSLPDCANQLRIAGDPRAINTHRHGLAILGTCFLLLSLPVRTNQACIGGEWRQATSLGCQRRDLPEPGLLHLNHSGLDFLVIFGLDPGAGIQAGLIAMKPA